MVGTNCSKYSQYEMETTALMKIFFLNYWIMLITIKHLITNADKSI